jgi:hypothetical protein
MYNLSLVTDITNKLTSDGALQESQADSVKDSIMDFLKDYAAIIWSIEDVKEIAALERLGGHELSDDEAREVIGNISKYADCEQGISWATVEWHVEDYLENKSD